MAHIGQEDRLGAIGLFGVLSCPGLVQTRFPLFLHGMTQLFCPLLYQLFQMSFLRFYMIDTKPVEADATADDHEDRSQLEPPGEPEGRCDLQADEGTPVCPFSPVVEPFYGKEIVARIEIGISGGSFCPHIIPA